MIRLLIYAAIAAALMGAIWGLERHVEGIGYDRRTQEYEAAAFKALRAAEKTVDTAATGHEADKVKIRTEFKVLTNEVRHETEKLVYRNVCFTDDGLRIIATAIGTDTATTSLAAGAMPAAVPAR